MPRTARSIEVGTIHHVLNRGNGQASNSPSAIPAGRGRHNKISDVPFCYLGILASSLPCPSLTVLTLLGFADFHGAGGYVLARNEAIRNYAPDLSALDRIPGEFACRLFWKFLGGAETA